MDDDACGNVDEGDVVSLVPLVNVEFKLGERISPTERRRNGGRGSKRIIRVVMTLAGGEGGVSLSLSLSLSHSSMSVRRLWNESERPMIFLSSSFLPSPCTTQKVFPQQLPFLRRMHHQSSLRPPSPSLLSSPLAVGMFSAQLTRGPPFHHRLHRPSSLPPSCSRSHPCEDR